MRLKEVSKEDFKLIFGKSPLVVVAKYKDLNIGYWVNQQPIAGIELNYKFSPDMVFDRYLYCDLTELYDSIINEVLTFTYNELSGMIEKNIHKVNQITPDSLTDCHIIKKEFVIGEMTIKK